MKKYYAFKGKKAIAGPFKTRAEAKAYGKPGRACRFCHENAGGNDVCWACLVILLSKPTIVEIPKVEGFHPSVSYA